MEGSESPIPIIDFDELGLHRKSKQTDGEALKKVGSLVRNAFSEVGFCYLKNHGFDQSLIDNYFAVTQAFFEQSLEEKARYAWHPEKVFGWIAVEREKLNPSRPGDLKEAFNFHPADDPDDWPTVDFQQASKEVFSGCAELAHRVCDALSVGLGLGKSFINDAHKYVGQKGNPTNLRSLYYPPITQDSKLKPGQIRLGEHSDYGTITLVFQDDSGGLEVEIPDKGFVPATPIPGTIIVNIGDLMQRWTADTLRATKHRVAIPDKEFKKLRQSVVFFGNPDDDYVIECLDGSNKYEPITCMDYLKYRFSVTDCQGP